MPLPVSNQHSGVIIYASGNNVAGVFISEITLSININTIYLVCKGKPYRFVAIPYFPYHFTLLLMENHHVFTATIVRYLCYCYSSCHQGIISKIII